MKKTKEPKEVSGLDALLKSVNKEYGAGTMIKSNSTEMLDIETTSTGCYSLDYVMGNGLPDGRIMEIHGAESSGKSTLAAYICSHLQKSKKKILWVDAEFSFSKEYYKNIGVKFNKDFLIVQPNCAEEAFDIIINAVKTGELDLIIVDSVSSLVPKDELDGRIDKASVALQARILSKALRMLTGSLANSKTTIIFINQLRDNIGVFFGNKTTTSGGRALKFYSSVRIEVKKGKKIVGAKEEVIGNEMFLCAVKNKVAPPFRKGKIELIYARGVDIVADYFEVGVSKGVIKRLGNTYTYKNAVLGSSKELSKNVLYEDEKLFEDIKKDIKNK